MSVKIIVAIGKDGAIGKNGDLIWKIPGDLKRFKALTTGHTVIMGRKTWESLPKRPLPGRRNIVITRNTNYFPAGAETAKSVQQALDITQNEHPFIIGGAEIYRAFLPYTTELFLTEVDSNSNEADTFLHLDLSDGWKLEEESQTLETEEGVKYKYVKYSKCC